MEGSADPTAGERDISGRDAHSHLQRRLALHVGAHDEGDRPRCRAIAGVSEVAGLDGMIELNTLLLSPGSPWVLTKTVAINDAGVTVGFGTFNGFAKCWIMYPQRQN